MPALKYPDIPVDLYKRREQLEELSEKQGDFNWDEIEYALNYIRPIMKQIKDAGGSIINLVYNTGDIRIIATEEDYDITNWIRCDGTPYLITTYPELFSKIGYSFGGSGDYFWVPDFRGRTPIGYGIGKRYIVPGDLTNRIIGSYVGQEGYDVPHSHGVSSILVAPHDATLNLTGTVTVEEYIGSVTPTVDITIDPIPYSFSPTASFTGNAGSITGSVALSVWAPSGAVTILPYTGNIIPLGAVSLSPWTPDGTISVASFVGNIVPLGSVVVADYIGNIVPLGAVALSSWTPIITTTLSAFTPSGAVTVNPFSGNIIPLGGVALSTWAPAGSVTVGNHTVDFTNIDNHTDTISETVPGHHHNVTITPLLIATEAGATPVAMPGTYTTTDTIVSIGLNLAHTGTQTLTHSASFAGTNSTQTATFTGSNTSINHTHTGTFAGNVSTQTASSVANVSTQTATFTGSNTSINHGHTATFTGSNTSINHGHTATFTGTLSTQTATFAGAATSITHTHIGTFSGVNSTQTASFTGNSFTPAGTVTVNPFSGNLSATGSGIISEISLDHTHEASVEIDPYDLHLTHDVSGNTDPYIIPVSSVQPSTVVNFIIKI